MLNIRRYGLMVLCFASLLAGAAEWNPVRQEPVSIGPESHRFIVGFRATPDNQFEHVVKTRRQVQGIRIVQAQTSVADVQALAQRSGIAMANSRQLTPSMHVLFLPKTLYGTDVDAALAQLRADPAVEFADVDARRYALAGGGATTPDDPLFRPTLTASPPASGQWYMQTPSATTIALGAFTTQDLSATDAVSAWGITTGSTGIVIADIDTGVRFDHPDLLRAGSASLGSGFGGRLLPGYDFVGEDYNPTTGAALGTFLIANDGDGWDPDPSDPGDWITMADKSNVLFSGDTPEDSSWHGTRVVGVYGALTNNGVGIAGMSWGPWILPVRALGKGGGYDSDIISGIEWAAGMTVAGVPDNPYPADIINLSIGGPENTCPSDYQTALTSVTQMGVLVVVAAGNGGTPGTTAPVEAPANCSTAVSGVVAVAGLRNVGTKVGYSSFGPEVTVSAPAGNCIDPTQGDPCLRSIDTTTNLGTTVPGADSYTNEQNFNLGTSFATPIVSGIAALMRSVNANLTPAQLVVRLQVSAAPFPANSNNLLVCPLNDSTTGECSCLGSGQCGTGMANALKAVKAAQAPIGVIAYPTNLTAGSLFDASASLPGCNSSAVPAVPLSIVAYAWSATGGVTVTGGANTDKATVNSGGGGSLILNITDSAGNVDTETLMLSASSVTSSTAEASAQGTTATACPASLAVNPEAPTVSEAFSPASVAEKATSTLTITFTNTNGFALTQSNFNTTLPSGLTIATTAQGANPEVATTCSGAALSLTATTTSVSMSDANIPAGGSCTITATVQSAAAGTYMSSFAANTLSTASAGGNAAAVSASLTVNAPSSGGGGALGWADLLVAVGLVAASRRRAWRRVIMGRRDSRVG